MYFVYRIELGGSLILCAHASNLLETRELMLEHVHEFISENEGKKKINERELKEPPTNCNDFADGYWFRHCDKDTMKLYFKTSKLNKGFFSETYEHHIEEVCKYSIVSYDKLSKSRGFTPVIVPKVQRADPIPEHMKTKHRNILKELEMSKLFTSLREACAVITVEEQ